MRFMLAALGAVVAVSSVHAQGIEQTKGDKGHGPGDNNRPAHARACQAAGNGPISAAANAYCGASMRAA